MSQHFVPLEIRGLFVGKQLPDAAYLGVLGPHGCGKSAMLRGLLELLGGDGADGPDADLVVPVALRDLCPSGEAEMFAQLINSCRSSLPLAVQRRVHSVNASAAVDSFDRMVGELLDAVEGRVFFVFDDMDAVPKSFARAVSRRFRGYWDQRGQDLQRHRVGFVFSGAFSGFKLTEEVESAITGGSTQTLPFSTDGPREELVRTALVAGDWQADPGVVELLAAETGGEPAFLGPVLGDLRRIGDDRQVRLQTVSSMVGDVDWLSRRVGALSGVLVNFCCDRELRRVVRELDGGAGEVRPRGQLDIDPLQLAGAVVVDREVWPNVYAFRNGMVRRFLEAVLSGVMGLEIREAPGKDWPVIATHAVQPGPAVQPLLDLESFRKRALEQRRIWGCLDVVAEAWKELSGCGDAEFDVVICGEDGPRADIVQASDRVRLVDPKSGHPVCAVVQDARRRRAVSVTVDREQATVAIRMGKASPSVFLVASASPGALCSGFGEHLLLHWIRWVQELGERINRLANREAVVALVNDRIRNDEDSDSGSAGDTNASLLERIGQLKQRIQEEADKELRFWKLACFLSTLLALGFLFWIYAPSLLQGVQDHWDKLEPMVFLVQVFGSLLLILMAFAGFRSDALQQRVWSRLGARIYRRRLKSSHLTELEGVDSPSPP